MVCRLLLSHPHMERPRPRIIIAVNNHDLIVVQVLLLAEFPQISYLSFHHGWVHCPVLDGFVVKVMSRLGLTFSIGPERLEIAKFFHIFGPELFAPPRARGPFFPSRFHPLRLPFRLGCTLIIPPYTGPCS